MTEKLVVFKGHNCGICKMVAPIVEQIKNERIDLDITECYIEDDTCRDKAVSFGVGGVPTMIRFNENGEIDNLVGFRPKQQLEEWLDSKF